MTTGRKKSAANPLLTSNPRPAPIVDELTRLQPQPADPPQTVVSQRVEYSFSGPLPPPQELQGYERALPGAAERIFQMREAEIRLTEQQVTHRIDIEKKVIDSDVTNSRYGVIAANVWLFAGLGMTTLFVMTGHELAGEIIGPAVVGSILAAFITGNVNRRKERIDKMKMLTGQEDTDKDDGSKGDPDPPTSQGQNEPS